MELGNADNSNVSSKNSPFNICRGWYTGMNRVAELSRTIGRGRVKNKLDQKFKKSLTLGILVHYHRRDEMNCHRRKDGCRECILFSLNYCISMFPSLVCFSRVLVLLTEDAQRDGRKPKMEKTRWYNLKERRCPFLESVKCKDVHFFWLQQLGSISCQSALAAVETFDRVCVCKCALFSGCRIPTIFHEPSRVIQMHKQNKFHLCREAEFFPVFNKHLLINKLHSVFVLCIYAVSCTGTISIIS